MKTNSIFAISFWLIAVFVFVSGGDSLVAGLLGFAGGIAVLVVIAFLCMITGGGSDKDAAAAFVILLILAGFAVLESSPQLRSTLSRVLIVIGCVLLGCVLLVSAVAVVRKRKRRTFWPSHKRLAVPACNSTSTKTIDADIIRKHGLVGQKLDWTELQEAIRLAKIQVADLSGQTHHWWSKLVLHAKLQLARHNILPSAASLLIGLAFASVLGVSVVVFGSSPSVWSWLSLVVQFILVTAVISWPIWQTLRYEPAESEDPLAYVQAELTKVEKLEAKWNSLCVIAESELARLTSKAEAIERAIDEQAIRDSRLDERKRLLAIEWDSLSGVEFEKMLRKVYELNGFQVDSTPATGDQGADLLVQKDGIKSCIQAKRSSSAVGNKAVQEAYAAKGYYRYDRCVVVTTNRFTKKAVELSGRLGCELIDREGLRSLIAGGHQQLLSQKPLPNPLTSSRAPTPYSTNEPADADLPQGEDRMTFDPEPAFQGDTPELAQTKIRSHAAKEWKDNYSMQLHVVEEEQAAYQKLQSYDHDGVPSNVYAGIRRAAAKEWPSQYSMQLDTTEEQIDAYRELLQLTPPDVPKESVREIKLSAVREWPSDFVMQLDTTEEQIEAYRELLQLTPSDVAKETVRKIKSSALREWPGDFVMQRHNIEAQLKAYRTLHRR